LRFGVQGCGLRGYSCAGGDGQAVQLDGHNPDLMGGFRVEGSEFDLRVGAHTRNVINSLAVQI
jgi:hypothetical protein